VSTSRVTIATGFDIGQRNEADLRKVGLSAGAIGKLKPYLGKTGRDAASLLQKQALNITSTQAMEIDKAVSKDAVVKLKLRYAGSANNTAKKDFVSLPRQAQTVIASVSFQYGDLFVRTPKFWKAVTSQDWKEAVRLLKNFGDSYPTRRAFEAALLGEIVK